MAHSDGREVIPEVGNIFGIAIENHDNDTDNRDHSVIWAAARLDNVWNTCASHGQVTFLEDNKLQYVAESAIDSTIKNELFELYAPNPLPEPWLTLDMGTAMDMPGEVDYVDGTVKVKASGDDIWGNADGMRFAFMTLSGDVEITAKVASLDSVHEWAKAGVMIRDELTTGSKHAYSCVTTAHGTRLQYRPETDGASSSEDAIGDLDAVAPYWVKLTRIGDTFTAYCSADGETWDMIGRTDVVMEDPVFVGGAVTSHDASLYTVAEFTDIDLSMEPKEPALNFNIAIDAEKDPWYRVLTGPADGMLNMPAAVYSDLGAPDDDTDLSVKVWTAWDSTYYYLYEEVNDDIILANNADNWWRNDIIELKIDPDPSAMTPQAGGSTISVALTALDSADATDGGQIANMPADGEYPGASPGDWARKKTSDGYVLEMRVKWDDLKHSDGREVTAEVGNIFGIAIENHDNDTDNRDHSVIWAAARLDNVWNTCASHGQVTFLEDNKLQYVAESAIDSTIKNDLAALYEPTGLPDPWLTMDIGDVGIEGNVTESDGVWEVTGGGADIWGSADAFRFAFQTLTGDVDIQAEITELTETNEWGKGGLMIRDALTPGSAHAMMVITSQHGAAFQWRPEMDSADCGSFHEQGVGDDATPPKYLKLQRIGDLLQGWISDDGSAWDKVGQIEIPMSEQIYVGMAVTAHDNALASVGTFSGVRIRTRNIDAVE